MSSLVHTDELSMLVLCHWEGGNLNQQFVDREDLYCCLLFHLLWPSLFRHVMDHSQHLNKIEETWHEILAVGYGKKNHEQRVPPKSIIMIMHLHKMILWLSLIHI